MNDKQLALLLRQIAGRIHALAIEVEPLIHSGEMGEDRVLSWSVDGKRIEHKITPRFEAVRRIIDLAASIEDEAELLSPFDPDEAE